MLLGKELLSPVLLCLGVHGAQHTAAPVTPAQLSARNLCIDSSFPVLSQRQEIAYRDLDVSATLKASADGCFVMMNALLDGLDDPGVTASKDQGKPA